MNKEKQKLINLFDSLAQNYVIEIILHREHSCEFWVIEELYSILYPKAYEEAHKEEE